MLVYSTNDLQGLAQHFFIFGVYFCFIMVNKLKIITIRERNV
jgi:hypothetical protein